MAVSFLNILFQNVNPQVYRDCDVSPRSRATAKLPVRCKKLPADIEILVLSRASTCNRFNTPILPEILPDGRHPPFKRLAGFGRFGGTRRTDVMLWHGDT
jgi:hypothetical protein